VENFFDNMNVPVKSQKGVVPQTHGQTNRQSLANTGYVNADVLRACIIRHSRLTWPSAEIWLRIAGGRRGILLVVLETEARTCGVSMFRFSGGGAPPLNRL
jgi:hypothetical protein